MASDYIFTCLHCNQPFLIYFKDFNCKILRHGVYRDTKQYMNPHASKEECEQLVKEEKIYGCGKPLRIVKKGDGYDLEICDYI